MGSGYHRTREKSTATLTQIRYIYPIVAGLNETFKTPQIAINDSQTLKQCWAAIQDQQL